MTIAAPLTLPDLHKALKGRLQVVADGFPLFETKSASRAPVVLDGLLPPKGTDAEQFPFLLVQPSSGTDSPQAGDQNSTAVVGIVVGTYSDSDDGWIDVLLLIEAIRRDLAEVPTITGTAFEHTGPLTWEIPWEQQARPQWLGRVTTTWTVPRPRRKTEEA